MECTAAGGLILQAVACGFLTFSPAPRKTPFGRITVFSRCRGAKNEETRVILNDLDSQPNVLHVQAQ